MLFKFCSCKSQSSLVLLLIVFSTTLHSQENTSSQSFNIGESRLFPGVSLTFLSNDNALRRSEGQIDNSGFVISPTIKWTADRRLLGLSAFYEGHFASFDQEATDFADHLVATSFNADFSSRSRLSGDASIEFTHNPLGTDFTRFVPEFLDQTEIRDIRLNARHRYGGKNAKANILTSISILDREFLNNELLTEGASFSRVTPSVGLSSRITGKTRAEIRLRGNSTDFKEEFRQDRAELGVLGGLTFEASEKSGGSVFLGATRASFDGASEGQAEFLAIVDAFLSPSRLSRIDLSVRRDFFDGAGANNDAGNQAVITRFDARWNYRWSDRLTHNLDLEIDNLSRNCPAESEVEAGFAFSVNLSIRRWLVAGLKIEQNQRDSGDCPNQAQGVNLDFEQRQLSLTLTGSL